MLSHGVRPRIAHGFTRLMVRVLVLTGSAVIVGVVVTTLGAASSYSDAIAGTMWLVGFIAALVVAGQLWGEFYGWLFTLGIDDESETHESASFASFILIPAGVVVIAIGTIVYILF